MIRAFFLLAVLASPAPAAPRLELSGQIKNLFESSRSVVDKSPYLRNMTRGRAEIEASASVFKARVEYDHELRGGSFLRSSEYRALGFSEPPPHFDLEQNISSGTDAHYRHRVHRGWIEAGSDAFALRFGRQRIAWGTGKIWNPVDVLNPYQPTSVEKLERPGVDAVHVRGAFGESGQAEAAYTLGDRWLESDLLGRGGWNWGGTDFSLLGGHVAASSGSWMLGGSWSSDLWGGNFHGELSQVDLEIVRPFFRGMAGYEYSFTVDPPLQALKDVWIAFEYLYNGRGSGIPRRYDTASLASGREVSLARHYLGTAFSKELNPLLKFETSVIWNADDRSHFVAPSLAWNPVGELHLTAGWQRFGGTRQSEYGRAANRVFGAAIVYF